MLTWIANPENGKNNRHKVSLNPTILINKIGQKEIEIVLILHYDGFVGKLCKSVSNGLCNEQLAIGNLLQVW